MKRMVTEKEIGEVAVDSVSEAIESGEIDLGNGVKSFEMTIKYTDLTKVSADWHTTGAYLAKLKECYENARAILSVEFGYGALTGNTALFAANLTAYTLLACNAGFNPDTYGGNITTDGTLSLVATPTDLIVKGGNDEFDSIDDVVAGEQNISIKILYI